MAEDFPPPASLQAFAKAAETLSFKEAAEALHVSPSALTRRIQALEEQVGAALFRRLHSGLELTPEGVRYLESVRRVLAELRRAQASVLPPVSNPLRISALESFTESWLVPHLPEFEKLHPQISLEVAATLRYADFDRDPVDVAIRFGTGPWDGLHSEPLVDLEVLPVCSPVLLHGDHPLASPADLAAHTLIRVSQVPESWPEWLRAAGVEDLVPKRYVTYDHLSIALAAAESAQGVALCARFLCAARLASGRLCIPFDTALVSRSTYHLVCRPEGLDDPRIVALRDWLVDSLA
ncbi:MAG TPA: LysR substrate-binding domain-containing protein [Candidatus Binatia bacterium]|jgi:LysR family glycine cleavage system transcriptional activator